MTLQAVIFDVDGTLADTEDAHRQAFNDAFEDCGLAWHWSAELYRELLSVAGGKERLRHYCQSVDPARLLEADANSFISRLHENKTHQYIRRVTSGEMPARPGVISLIQELCATGVRLAIATTSSRENVDVLLNTTLADLPTTSFEVIGAGEQTTAKKPAADIYQWVLRKLNLSAHDCLAIEDSKNGVRAACAAGIPVLVTQNHWTCHDDFSGAIAVLSDLTRVDAATLHRLHAEART